VHDRGQQQALRDLGLDKTAAGLGLRTPRDPLIDVTKKLKKALTIKTPKFDFSALVKRLLNNPLKQPQAHIAGKWPGLKL
jgi:hypothetical protein